MNVLNKDLYSKATREAKKRFAVFPSAVASAWVVKRYKNLGGKYRRTAKRGKTLSRSIAKWRRSKRSSKRQRVRDK
jgi:hypothetical protein